MTSRATTWWQGVDEEAEDLTGVREPWADQPLFATALTDDQRAVLAGLDDQPDGPRLDGIKAEREAGDVDQPSVPRFRPGNGTGNAPGDPGRRRPYRPHRWTERGQDQ